MLAQREFSNETLLQIVSEGKYTQSLSKCGTISSFSTCSTKGTSVLALAGEDVIWNVSQYLSTEDSGQETIGIKSEDRSE